MQTASGGISQFSLTRAGARSKKSTFNDNYKQRQNSMQKKVFLAVDLGAGSGRIMAAVYDGKKIGLEEVARWASEPVKIGGSFHWEVNNIFKSITDGLRKAKSIYGGAIVSLGIDTWGVDYGLLGKGDKLLNLPFIYRDSRTDGMMDAVFAKISKAEIYAKTGIQFMFFNTLFQIMAELEKQGNIDKAESFLMMQIGRAHV